MTQYEESLVNPNMRDEVLKLILIVRHDQDGCFCLGIQSSFSQKYLLEKLERIHNGIPLAIHPRLQRIFNEMKEKEEGGDEN